MVNLAFVASLGMVIQYVLAAVLAFCFLEKELPGGIRVEEESVACSAPSLERGIT